MNKAIRFPWPDYYILLSFFCTSALWVVLYLENGLHFGAMFLPSLLVSIHHYFLANVYGRAPLYQRSEELSIYLFLQSFLILALSFDLDFMGFQYLSLVPILVGISFLVQVKMSARKKMTSNLIAFASIYFLGQYSLRSFYNLNVSNTNYALFLIFCAWAMGATYLFSLMARSKKHSYLQKLKEENHHELRELGLDGDRLFYHDFVNQMHGILLFLENRKKENLAIEPGENKLLVKEIQILQGIFQDHYGFSHRNQHNLDDYINFHKVKEIIEKTILNYLPDMQVGRNIIYRGLAEQGKHHNSKSCAVHFAYFHRILVNLIKNINDHARASHVEIIFDCDEDIFKLSIKNKIFKNQQVMDLSQTLKSNILSGQEGPYLGQQLGLHSITALAKLMDGEFHFCIDKGYWISEVEFKAIFVDGADSQELLLGNPPKVA